MVGRLVRPGSFERLIVDFAWKELFWHRRAELLAKMRFLAFGHALYEKALDPHLGMVAKTVFVPPGDTRDTDARLAAHFADRANFAVAQGDGADAGAGDSGLAPGTRSARPSTTTPCTSAGRRRGPDQRRPPSLRVMLRAASTTAGAIVSRCSRVRRNDGAVTLTLATTCPR